MNDTEKTSRAAKDLGRLGGLKGGKARAQSLSAEERSEIARLAVEARWAKVRGDESTPGTIRKATHGSPEKPLRIANFSIACYVLEDELRVLSGRGMQEALGLGQGHGTKLKEFLRRRNLKPFIDNDLAMAIENPVRFTRPGRGGKVAVGYDATILVDICDAVLAARKAGALSDKQLIIADQCEILARSFAKVGIIALIDEATGYQYTRGRAALEEILERFISKELLKWAKMFPDDFYGEMFRLRGWPYPPPAAAKRPMQAGKLTLDLVYERLAPGVLRELKRLTPRDEKGRLKQKLFQRLTENVGHPRLREHLSGVIALMKAADDWEIFYRGLQRAYPKFNENLMLSLPPPEDEAGR